MRARTEGIEEIDKGGAGPRWDEGLELRRDEYGPGTTFRLLLGGACVGVLRVEHGASRVLTELPWAGRLLDEVFDEWRRCEGVRLPMAA